MSASTDTGMSNGGTKPIQDYLVTINMAKELCMMSYTEKGKEIRKYFVQVKKNWNNPDMVMNRALNIAATRVKLLQAQNDKLLEDNEQLQDKIKHGDDDKLQYQNGTAGSKPQRFNK